MTIRSSFRIIALLAAAAALHAQIVTEFAGQKNAIQFAYGLPGIQFPALQVSSGNGATGSSSITLVTGQSVNSGGVGLNPLNINAPITVGIGSNADTVTPTALSGCNLPVSFTNGPAGPNCTITASFNHLHGPGEPVTSGTYGLQEAINRAQGQGGGVVIIDASWGNLGGTNAIITAAAPFSNVYVRDNRGLPVAPFWSMQPTTLTLLAAPAVLTSSTVASGTATGTWTAADTFFCVTYIDPLGGEGPCSPTYDVTLTASVAVNFTNPAPASTGAVGWRAYAGASYAAAYLLPITSANCTLSTLETVVPACAIGVNAVFPTANTTTTQLKPAPAIPLAAANNIVPQGHTTFAYEPTGYNLANFQTNYAPFAVMSGGTTAGQVAVLGTMQLPAGYLNQIGRTVRVSGKIVGSVNTATTPSVLLKLGWPGGDTAGVGITLATMIDTVAYGATATFNHNFVCYLTTNAVGATAIGTIQPACTLTYANEAGTTIGVTTTDTAASAVGSLNLATQDTLYVYYTGATNATSSLQLMGLTVETLQ